jgi:hypothetical protein
MIVAAASFLTIAICHSMFEVFYRFLNEHLRRQRQARAGEGVSDR